MVTRYEVEAEASVGWTTCGSLIVTGYLINLAATSGWPTRQPARNTVLPPGSMSTQAFKRPTGMKFNNASEMFGHCLSLPLKLTAPRGHTLKGPPSNLTSQFSFITGVLIWPFSTFFKSTGFLVLVAVRKMLRVLSNCPADGDEHHGKKDTCHSNQGLYRKGFLCAGHWSPYRPRGGFLLN